MITKKFHWMRMVDGDFLVHAACPICKKSTASAGLRAPVNASDDVSLANSLELAY